MRGALHFSSVYLYADPARGSARRKCSAACEDQKKRGNGVQRLRVALHILDGGKEKQLLVGTSPADKDFNWAHEEWLALLMAGRRHKSANDSRVTPRNVGYCGTLQSTRHVLTSSSMGITEKLSLHGTWCDSASTERMTVNT